MADGDNQTLAETVLHDWHAENGAKMVPFGGWDMPVQYASGIIQEHLATRRNAGLFDVSHMGRFRVTGPAAEALAGAENRLGRRLVLVADPGGAAGHFEIEALPVEKANDAEKLPHG